MSEQHYFSETPETEFKPRPVQVELAGRKVTVTTANGIFSPSGIDKGTAILLQEAPDPQGERMLDIGCRLGTHHPDSCDARPAGAGARGGRELPLH